MHKWRGMVHKNFSKFHHCNLPDSLADVGELAIYISYADLAREKRGNTTERQALRASVRGTTRWVWSRSGKRVVGLAATAPTEMKGSSNDSYSFAGPFAFPRISASHVRRMGGSVEGVVFPPRHDQAIRSAFVRQPSRPEVAKPPCELPNPCGGSPRCGRRGNPVEAWEPQQDAAPVRPRVPGREWGTGDPGGSYTRE